VIRPKESEIRAFELREEIYRQRWAKTISAFGHERLDDQATVEFSVVDLDDD
jgi:hypothetical protein